MIGWTEIYKVIVAVVPLYVAMGLGYASLKWWKFFEPEHTGAINRLTAYIIFPFFIFDIITEVDPYNMNFRFIIGDVVAKGIVLVGLAIWANLFKNGSFSWAITSFSLCTLNNSIVVGPPLLQAMYGQLGRSLVLQSAVMQFLIWFPLLLFMLDFWAAIGGNAANQVVCDEPPEIKLDEIEIEIVVGDGKNAEVDQELENVKEVDEKICGDESLDPLASYDLGKTLFKVLIKLVKNPNVFGCGLAIIWALVSKRWNIQMPSIVQGSILIMSKAGSGVSMFTAGLFLAQQKKIIACGTRLTLFAFFMRFGIGALSTAIGCLALGLRSNALRVAIVQAALPQAITSFVFAKEYNLHPDVLSTAVMFGTIVSVPLLIGYYAVLDVIP